MKLPAFQFYPGDWRKDPGVQSLDYQCRGVWLEMLCLMHESERRGVLLLNGKAMPDDALARLLGLDVILLKQILTTLVNHGVTSVEDETGAIMCRRMVRDENLRKTRAEAGKQGGNPVLLKQKPTTRVKQKPTPSSSSSVSSSDDLPPAAPAGKRKERNPLFDALAEACGSDPHQMTTNEARACGVALAGIRKASPAVTPEDLAARATNYRTHYNGAALTPSALCAHWSVCAKPNSNNANNRTSNTRSFEQCGDYSGILEKL